MNIPNHTDILVIGSGLSGAIATISAADEGKNVLIITKAPILKSGNTPKAQGGIVYKAGGNHCWNDAVDLICTEGPKLVKKLLIGRFHVELCRINSQPSTSSPSSYNYAKPTRGN